MCIVAQFFVQDAYFSVQWRTFFCAKEGKGRTKDGR
jgi:hypothetical protein